MIKGILHHLRFFLNEMSDTLSPNETGLSKLIWLSTEGELSNAQSHALGRIKVKIQSANNMPTISIDPNTKGVRKIKGDIPNKILKEVLTFIVLNNKLLKDYWLNIRSFEDIKPHLKKYSKEEYKKLRQKGEI